MKDADLIRCESCYFLTVRRSNDGMGECTYCGAIVDKETMGALAIILRAEKQIKPPLRTLPPLVYYIRWADRIKIGTSENIRQRLGSIYHDEVLAVEPGGRTVEAMRHNQFSEYRLPRYKEWFSDAPALIFHANTIREKHETLLKAI